MQTVRPRCASLAFGAALLSWGAASAADIETAALPTLEFGAHPRTNGWVDFGLRAPAADNAELLIYDTGDATIPAGTGASGSAAPGWVPALFTRTA
jgi:hypothetical protein